MPRGPRARSPAAAWIQLCVRDAHRRAAVARVHLGDVWLRLDKPLRALHAYSSALEVFVAAGDRWWQARANQGAGEAYAGLRIYRPALFHLNAALPVYTDLANERLSRRVEMRIDQVKNRQRGNFVMASAPLYNLLARIAKSLARRVPVM